MSADDQTAGYQEWRRLSFLHWSVSPEEIQRLLPSPLTVDCYDDRAWVGLVPFSMERIRPWWSPAVPGVSWFLETNLRTYVRTPSGSQGVWFFSLDANQRLAVRIARNLWKLPYFDAVLRMSDCQVNRDDSRRAGLEYQGRRTEQPAADYRMVVCPTETEACAAAVDTLEHFLVERYTLFCVNGRGQLLSGKVHHEPYRIQPIDYCELSQTVTAAAGISVADPCRPDHAVYSAGVSVRVSPLKPVYADGLSG